LGETEGTPSIYTMELRDMYLSGVTKKNAK